MTSLQQLAKFPRRLVSVVPGVAVAAGLSAVAGVVAQAAPGLGAAAVGLLLGLAAALLAEPPASLRPGVSFAGRSLLRLGVVLLGASLDPGQMLSLAGRGGLAVVVCASLAAAVAYAAARWLRVQGAVGHLLAVGTAICGASAIATVSPLVRARREEVAVALGLVFLFNAAAVIAYPVVGRLAGLDGVAFGTWVAVAVHDTSSVLAAAHAFGETAVKVAAVVKLGRTLLLVPAALLLAVATGWRREASGRLPLRNALPGFLAGFLALSAANGLGWVPPDVGRWASEAGRFLLVTAIVAFGLGVDRGALRSVGWRPFGVCLAASGAVAVVGFWLSRAV